MAALDGKITIERELRPCITSVLDVDKFFEVNIEPYKDCRVFKTPKKKVKSLFHCWNPVTGNAIIEYEDGTIHEVEPTQIRFVDNAMSEYVFPEMEEKSNG